MTSFFDFLLRTSAEAVVLIGLILLIQKIAGQRISPRARHALWWLLVVRLLLPWLPQSTWSVYNLNPHQTTMTTPLAGTTQVVPSVEPTATAEVQATRNRSSDPKSQANIQAISPAPSQGSQSPRQTDMLPGATPSSRNYEAVFGMGDQGRHGINWKTWCFLVWLAGSLYLVTRIGMNYLRFHLALRRGGDISESATGRLWRTCQEQCGLSPNIPVRETSLIQSPALFGAHSLTLLLPKQADRLYDRHELRHIFLHELAHVRRLDHWSNWLMTLLQVFHWFNPVIWYALERMRLDRELAADYLALTMGGEPNATAYGETILKTLRQISHPPVTVGLIGLLETNRRLKQRFEGLSGFLPSRRFSRWALGAAFIPLSMVTLTSAIQRPGNSDVTVAGDAISLLDPDSSAVAPTFLGSWTFVGVRDGTRLEGGEVFKSILRSKETQDMILGVGETLARSFHRHLPPDAPSRTSMDASRVAQLWPDLLTFPSYGEVHGNDANHFGVTMWVQLPSDRQQDWSLVIREHLKSIGWTIRSVTEVPEQEQWEATIDQGHPRLRFNALDGWMHLQWGMLAGISMPGDTRQVNQKLDALQDAGSLGGLVLQPGQFGRIWEDFGDSLMDRIAIEFRGEGDYLRTHGTFTLSRELDAPGMDWSVPTNLIQEPVAAFSAQRGLQPLLASLEGAAGLFPAGMPDQYISWARMASAQNKGYPMFMHYAAWPVDHAEPGLAPIRDHLTEFMPRISQTFGPARIRTEVDPSRLHLQMVPAFMTPFVQEIRYGEDRYHLAGLSTLTTQRTNPPPAALFQQLETDPKLMYYHWELSDRALAQSRNLINLLSFMSGGEQLLPDSPIYTWSRALEEHLGNTVTQITHHSPRVLSFQRKSHLGLTGLEIALLSKWMHAPSFPDFDLEAIKRWGNFIRQEHVK